MEAAGFVDIEFRDQIIPVGAPWHPDPKTVEKGIWWKMAAEADLEGE